MKKQLIGFGAGMSLLSFAGYVDAATVNYAAKLTGAEVVPPVTTTATGDAKCSIDDTTYKTTCTITETGIGKVTTVALYLGAKGKDGFGVETKPETLANLFLMADLSPLFGTKKKVYAGPGFEYWNNKFGGQNSDAPAPGTNRRVTAPMLQVQVHF